MTSMEAFSIGFWGTVGYVVGSVATILVVVMLIFAGVFVYAIVTANRHKKRDR